MSTATEVYPGGVAGGGRALVGGHAQALTEEPAHGPSKRIVVAFGFWIFLISDIILFAALFATYAVLTDATAGGPSAGHRQQAHDTDDSQVDRRRAELHAERAEHLARQHPVAAHRVEQPRGRSLCGQPGRELGEHQTG